jgi:hypothetical protein
MGFTCTLHRPFYASLFNHPNNIRCAVDSVKLYILWFPPMFCYFLLKYTGFPLPVLKPLKLQTGKAFLRNAVHQVTKDFS